MALWQDVRTDHIRNHLIALGLCISYLQCICTFGFPGIFIFLIRFFFPIFILYLLFLMHALGAGDIKLFSVICTFIGIRGFIQVLCSSFLVGAILSLAVLIQNNNLWLRLSCLKEYVRSLILNKKMIPYDYKSDKKRNYIHFSIAVFWGYILNMARIMLV